MNLLSVPNFEGNIQGLQIELEKFLNERFCELSSAVCYPRALYFYGDENSSKKWACLDFGPLREIFL